MWLQTGKTFLYNWSLCPLLFYGTYTVKNMDIFCWHVVDRKPDIHCFQ